MAEVLNALSNLFTLLFVVTSMLSMGLALPSARPRLTNTWAKPWRVSLVSPSPVPCSTTTPMSGHVLDRL